MTTRVVGSVLGATLVLGIGVATSFWAFRQIEQTAQARQHSSLVISGTEALLSSLKDAETGQRGYSLTGDEAFLEPYLAVRDRIADDEEQLSTLVGPGSARAHLEVIAPLVREKLAELAQVIALRRANHLPEVIARVSSGVGKHQMDLIRVEVAAMVALEQADLLQHERNFQSDMHRLFSMIVFASLCGLLLALWFAALLQRQAQSALAAATHRNTQARLEEQSEANRKLTEVHTELQGSEERLGVTLSSIGDAVLTTDATGRVTMLNPVAERLTGWTQSAATGRPMEEILRLINQTTRRPCAIPITATLACGTIQGMENHTVLIARDGAERAIADSCAPIRDRSGAVVGAVLVFRDVSAEYAAQRALHDGAALLQTILDSVADGIMTLHASGGMIESVNPAAQKLFGYSAAELVGRSISTLIPELAQYEKSGFLDRRIAGPRMGASTVSGVRSNGSRFPLEFALSEMSLNGERYLTGVFRDITARKQMEDERAALERVLLEKNTELENARSSADQANLAKSDFLSAMSHELRTPLNAILGFAQLLESETPPPTGIQATSIAQILLAGWHLLALINEVLDLAKIESRQVPLSEEPVSLAEVLVECQGMIEPQAQQHGVTLIFPSISPARFVSADRMRLKQVLINLLSNAIKYNVAKGTVTVDCAESVPGRTRVSIKDTGAGLAPDQLRQLFQPFNRLGQEGGGEEGTGIGLVVSKQLVELMGGSIGVESTVGLGSTFWFELITVAEPHLVTAATDPLTTHGAAPRTIERKHTLLYVEDNPANMKLIAQIVARQPDIHLLTATNGLSGVEIARATLPDVILMDINVPGINGFESLRRLRSHLSTARIPVIALSANAMERDVSKGLKAGFLRYITKPIRVNEFMEALNAALDAADGGRAEA